MFLFEVFLAKKKKKTIVSVVEELVDVFTGLCRVFGKVKTGEGCIFCIFYSKKHFLGSACCFRLGFCFWESLLR